MLLNDVVSASARVAGTRSRLAKTEALVGLLHRCPPEDLDVVVTWLGGAPRQRRTGIGHRSLTHLPAPATDPTLQVAHVDAELERAAHLAGPGSQAARATLVQDLFAAATAPEQEWLRALVLGNLRQGALDAAVQGAVAAVAEVPLAQVRRAAMMAGSTAPVAVAALTADDPARASAALADFTLQVGRPIQPMLASSAPTVAEALAKLGDTDPQPVVVDAKLDGIRLQVHRRAGTVLAVTRSLDDITDRLPEVVQIVAGLPGGDLVLDGEAMVVNAEGRPVPFQETASRTATSGEPTTGRQQVRPFFFDLLHRDGTDLVDAPLTERLDHLAAVVPAEFRTESLRTADPEAAQAFTREVLAAGHEGVVVKDPRAAYAAGRRGAAWIKVKPVHTLDLVVLAVEHGSGRRRGWLSNIHLGARDPGTGAFVMVGKTFKGMTDEMLAWQTQRFRDLASSQDEWTVHVRPEQVVEIAVDGVQRSPRYPGGVALRFARVVRYRDDKRPEEADTIEMVRGLL